MIDPTATDEIRITREAAAGGLAEIARFAARVIGADTRYISHGEIQTGLSDDLVHWAPDLTTLYAGDFAAIDDRCEVMSARDTDGVLMGIAVIAWEETPRRRFAVLEDMAIAPEFRSRGIGAQLLAAVEARVASAGVQWLFLESGVRNDRAHQFFERSGFAMTSHVFAKQI